MKYYPIRKTALSVGLAGIAAAGMCLAGAASAADLGPAPSEFVVSEWAGPYVGLHVGYASLNSSNSVEGEFAQSWKQGADGPMGGVLLGYNFDVSGFVLGVEADAGFGNISETLSRPGIGDIRITDHGQHSFRLRAGLPTGPGLLYLTGGLALADIWARGPGGRSKKFYWGGTVGAGFETMISDQVSARFEYLYADYGKDTYSLGGLGMRSAFDSHTLRLGASWHFR
ncbi:MAG: outer membrane protein [Hyphomicrobiales bacterium]